MQILCISILFLILRQAPPKVGGIGSLAWYAVILGRGMMSCFKGIITEITEPYVSHTVY